MHHLALLAPLRSFVVSKASKLLSWCFRGFKYALRHPLKLTFNIIKLWFCMMMLTVFSSIVLADEIPPQYRQYDMDNLQQPEAKLGYVCSTYRNGSHSLSVQYPEACGDWAYEIAANSSALSPYCKVEKGNILQQQEGFLSQQLVLYSSNENGCVVRAGYDGYQVSWRQSEVEDLYCPPDAYPQHEHKIEWPIGSGQIYCAKLLVGNDPNEDPDQKSCADLVGNDSSFYSVTVNKNKYSDSSKIKCLENGSKLCETTSSVFIDTDVGDNFVRYSPVGGGTFTGNECKDVENLLDDEQDPPPEDKFCTVNNSSGIYSVDCPESQIAINWNTVKGLAEASAKDNQRIADIEASFLTKDKIAEMVANNELGDLKGEKGDKGDKGEQGIQGGIGAAGADGLDGKDGEDGEDGENCNVISTSQGAMISCAESTAEIQNGDSCTTTQLSNGDAQISCEDGTTSEINGVDEDGIVGALNTQLDEMKKQTGIQEGSLEQLEFQTEELKKISTYDGDKPIIDYETKPDAWTEIEEFDWEQTNFGTVLEEHMDELRGLPLFSAIDDFFVTSFGGSCPTWQETVTVLDASFNIRIDQFCSSAVQSILPAIKAIIMLVAGFFAWRIAIE